MIHEHDEEDRTNLTKDFDESRSKYQLLKTLSTKQDNFTHNQLLFAVNIVVLLKGVTKFNHLFK